MAKLWPSQADSLTERMEAEIRPKIDDPKFKDGYNCCGCSTYGEILDHAIRIVREAVQYDTDPPG